MVSLRPLRPMSTMRPMPPLGSDARRHRMRPAVVLDVRLPARPQEQVAGVVDLPRHHGAGDGRPADRVVGPAELPPPQKHVARPRGVHPADQPAGLGQEADGHTPLGAQGHYRRSDVDAAEDGHGLQLVDRDDEAGLPLDLDPHGQVVAAEGRPSGDDI